MRNLQQSVLRGGDRFTVFRSFNPPISRSNWANAFISIPDDRAITLLTDYRQIPVEWLGQQFFDEAERLRKINPQAYENEYLGLAVGNGAEVFPNLEIREITDQEINHLQYIYQGQDFGFASDPAAFVRLGYDAKHDTIYFIDELYVTKWSNAAVCDWIKEKGYNDYLVICDSAEPKSIADFIDNSIWARGCYKKPGAVVYRIKWLQHRRIVIDPKRTPNSSREFQNYAYKVDSKTGEVLPELPDKNNHTIDACAYAMNSVIWQRYNNTTA
jgi:PBSX family phage terminase large subunit